MLFMLMTTSAWSQVSLFGQVQCAEDKRAIAGAQVSLLSVDKHTLTQSDGYFVLLLDSFPHALKLTIRAVGYEMKTVQVHAENIGEPLSIVLEPRVEMLGPVQVVDDVDAQKQHLAAIEGTNIYAGKKTEVVDVEQSLANLSANNARQIYAKVSGINVFEGGQNGLQLNIGGRGLNPNRTASFNTRQNGYDISADVLGYPESYYTPPAEALSTIQVVRGAASLQYGTQFGGMVNFVLKGPLAHKGLSVVSRNSVSRFNGFNHFTSVSAKHQKLGIYGFYQYRAGDGFRPNSGYEAHQAYLHVDYALSAKTKLVAEFTHMQYLAQQAGGLTDLQFYQDPYQSNRTRNWFAVNWNLAAIKCHHQFSPMAEWHTQVYGLHASREAVGFRTNRVSQIDDVSSPRDLLIGTFQNVGVESKFLQRYLFKGVDAAFLVGGKYYQSYNTAVQGPGSANNDADFTLHTTEFPHYPRQSSFSFPNQNVALFTENVFWLHPKLSITPGVRFEYIHTQSRGQFSSFDFDLAGNAIRQAEFEDNRSVGRSRWLAGIGLSYKPHMQTEWFANVSQNYRSVTFNDIRVINPSLQIDPHIRDENGFTADMGTRGMLRSWLSYDVSLFAILYRDRIGEVLRTEQRLNAEGIMRETGRIVRYRGNIGTALISGLESKCIVDIMRLAQAKDAHWQWKVFANSALTKGEYIDAEIPGVEGNQLEYVPLLNVKAGSEWSYKKWQMLLQYTYLSKQFTDATNAPQRRNDNQSGIVGAIPAYQVVDLAVHYSHESVRLETGIDNLLNAAYFTRRATGYPGPGIIPSAPRTYYCTLQFTF